MDGSRRRRVDVDIQWVPGAGASRSSNGGSAAFDADSTLLGASEHEIRSNESTSLVVRLIGDQWIPEQLEAAHTVSKADFADLYFDIDTLFATLSVLAEKAPLLQLLDWAAEQEQKELFKQKLPSECRAHPTNNNVKCQAGHQAGAWQRSLGQIKLVVFATSLKIY